jgi:hypothetical protein
MARSGCIQPRRSSDRRRLQLRGQRRIRTGFPKHLLQEKTPVAEPTGVAEYSAGSPVGDRADRQTAGGQAAF